MKTLVNSLKYFILFLLLTSPAYADEKKTTPVELSLVDCLKAVAEVDPMYRGAMQLHCVHLIGTICDAHPDPDVCLKTQNSEMRDLYAATRPNLPESIEKEGEISNRLYQKALERFTRTFGGTTAGKSCATEGEHLEIYDRQTYCEFATLATATLSLFHWIEKADEALP